MAVTPEALVACCTIYDECSALMLVLQRWILSWYSYLVSSRTGRVPTPGGDTASIVHRRAINCSMHAGGTSEKRKARLRVAAKKRRHESIQRAAPKALNPYGSDESDSEGDAGPGAALERLNRSNEICGRVC